MQRRALLSSIAGSTAVVAGCAAPSNSTDTAEVYNPTGMATIRPLDEPIMQHGLKTGSGQYLYGRLFQPEETLPVTQQPDAERYSQAVEDVSEGEFAVFTNLRAAAGAPAYVWPADTEWSDGRLEITLERQTLSYDGTGDEVVGVALTTFQYDGTTPTGADLIFPSGATISVGQAD